MLYPKLLYYFHKRKKRFNSLSDIEDRRVEIFCELVAFNMYAYGSGSDRQWADPKTYEGHKAIVARTDEMLKLEMDSDDATLSMNSVSVCSPVHEHRVKMKIEDQEDFDSWIDPKKPKKKICIKF